MGKKSKKKEAKRSSKVAALEASIATSSRKIVNLVSSAVVLTQQQERFKIERILKMGAVEAEAIFDSDNRCLICKKPNPKLEVPDDKNSKVLNLCSDNCMAEHTERNIGTFLEYETDDDDGAFEEFLLAQKSPDGYALVTSSSGDSKSKFKCYCCHKMTNGASKKRNTYQWQNMAFCSDTCVGSFQMIKGSSCFICSATVAYESLGKYCELFGDVLQQFCGQKCLDGYKNSVHLCEFCQMGLQANQLCLGIDCIAGKPRMVFCADECVIAYYEKILKRRILSKPNMAFECRICLAYRPMHRELKHDFMEDCVACSEDCWEMLMHKTGVKKTLKCHSCSKEMIVADHHSVARLKISSLFCSDVCRVRNMLMLTYVVVCIGCKKEGRSNEMIQAYHGPELLFSICNLACLPQSHTYKTILEKTVSHKRYLLADGLKDTMRSLSLGNSKRLNEF